MNAMGQTLFRGFAVEGSERSWSDLNSGWYVVKTEHGRTPFVVSR